MKINGDAVPLSPLYAVQFAGGQFTGKVGCNGFGAPYSLGEEAIFLGPVVATKMACSGRGGSDENAAFEAMRAPLRIFWTNLGSRLVLTSERGSLDLERIR